MRAKKNNIHILLRDNRKCIILTRRHSHSADFYCSHTGYLLCFSKAGAVVKWKIRITIGWDRIRFMIHNHPIFITILLHNSSTWKNRKETTLWKNVFVRRMRIKENTSSDSIDIVFWIMVLEISQWFTKNTNNAPIYTYTVQIDFIEINPGERRICRHPFLISRLRFWIDSVFFVFFYGTVEFFFIFEQFYYHHESAHGIVLQDRYTPCKNVFDGNGFPVG